jgi:hypothetical protein
LDKSAALHGKRQPLLALLGAARLREDHAIEQVVGGKRQAVDWAQAL